MTKLRHALSFSSSTYKNHVFAGFARLQQNDEFVDMTLAADGHWVKVHRTLVALSSPYFRELLRSMPCQHPVIYLNGVSNEALGYILEYIYTGEAEIPAGKVESFLNTAQGLQIAGLKNVIPPEENEISSQNMDAEHMPNNSNTHMFEVTNLPMERIHNVDNYPIQPQEPPMNLTKSRIKSENNDQFSTDVPMSSEVIHEFQSVGNMNAPGKTINVTLNENASNDNNRQSPVAKIEILNNVINNRNSGLPIIGQDQLPQSYTEALLHLNNNDMPLNNRNNISFDISPSTSQLPNDGEDIPMSEDIDESGLQDYDNIATRNNSIQIINLDSREQLREIIQQDSVLYTVSNRGALQLILNRFMYYCHYQRDNGRKRRWRCIDYRDAHCPAAIDTVGEQIVERKHKHCHPNHDERIRKKMSRINVKCFPTIELAQALSKQEGLAMERSDEKDAP